MNINRNNIRTLVVKIGTTLLSGERGFDGRILEGLVKEITALKRERNLNILLVSSGALGCGMDVLGLKERPKLLPLKQATAAVGQARLMHYYEVLFQSHGDGLHVAQVLVSASDLDDRRSYLNLRNTINALFNMKTVVPIVNENDSVATDELRFGDNDTLAARVSAKIAADLLIILSDVDGLFDKNPAKYPNAKLIKHVMALDDNIEALAEDTAVQTSTGGMKTKLKAAKIASSVGLSLVIASGRRAGIIRGVLEGTAPCTLFSPAETQMPQRKRWIAFGRSTRGALRVDEGARNALLTQGRSLLAAGITSVSGVFEIGASVRVVDQQGRDVACGLVNYGSEDIKRIMGRKSREIEAVLGRKDYDEVIHRDNLVLLETAAAPQKLA